MITLPPDPASLSLGARLAFDYECVGVDTHRAIVVGQVSRVHLGPTTSAMHAAFRSTPSYARTWRTGRSVTVWCLLLKAKHSEWFDTLHNCWARFPIWLAEENRLWLWHTVEHAELGRHEYFVLCMTEMYRLDSMLDAVVVD